MGPQGWVYQQFPLWEVEFCFFFYPVATPLTQNHLRTTWEALVCIQVRFCSTLDLGPTWVSVLICWCCDFWQLCKRRVQCRRFLFLTAHWRGRCPLEHVISWRALLYPYFLLVYLHSICFYSSNYSICLVRRVFVESLAYGRWRRDHSHVNEASISLLKFWRWSVCFSST